MFLGVAAQADPPGQRRGLVNEVLAAPAGLLSHVEAERRVLSAKVEAEVEAALARAKRVTGQDPAQAESDLKLTLDVVDRLPDIDPALRSRLRQSIEAAIRTARRERTAFEQRRLAALESQAAAGEQQRWNGELAKGQQRIKQIVDRFGALLDERRHDIAVEQIAAEVERLALGSTTESSLALGGPVQRAVHENEETWRKRGNNVVRSLAGVESAAVPFPDVPPLAYPAAEQWQTLSLQRGQYKAVTLHERGTAEQRIFDELNKPASLDVVEMPLREVVLFLAETHGLPIVLSTKKLKEAGLSAEVPITKRLHGVTLRSALRLILKDLDLSYIVEDEVIQITTPEEAANQLTHKVYPVGDLVVPIRPPTNVFGLGGLSGAGGINGGPGMGNPLGGGMPNGGGNANPGMNLPGAGVNPGINMF